MEAQGLFAWGLGQLSCERLLFVFQGAQALGQPPVVIAVLNRCQNAGDLALDGGQARTFGGDRPLALGLEAVHLGPELLDKGPHQLGRHQLVLEAGEDPVLDLLAGDGNGVCTGAFGASRSAAIAILGHDRVPSRRHSGYHDAARRLGRAAELLPDDSRVHYNLALVLERLERLDATESSLRNAMRLAPNDPDILYALAFHNLNRGRLDEAEALGRRFVELHPERSEGGQLLERITRQKETKK